MIRRFLVSLVLALVVILSLGISPVLAEKQYTQTQQMPAKTEPTFKQEPYTQSQQTFKQEPYTQAEQKPAQSDQKPKTMDD
jgi:hypothetical protein